MGIPFVEIPDELRRSLVCWPDKLKLRGEAWMLNATSSLPHCRRARVSSTPDPLSEPTTEVLREEWRSLSLIL